MLVYLRYVARTVAWRVNGVSIYRRRILMPKKKSDL